MLKVNNINTITRCEICSKLTIKTPEWRHWHRSGVFIFNFEHSSHVVLVFLSLTLSTQIQAGFYPSSPISVQCCISDRNQSFNLHCKIEWLVSIWKATLGWTELLCPIYFHYFFKSKRAIFKLEKMFFISIQKLFSILR